MKHSLTICYVTSRLEPEVKWFIDSLISELRPVIQTDIIIIDLFCRDWTPLLDNYQFYKLRLGVRAPKPSYWQGEHRLTKENWWAVANARNTAFCLCHTDWIAFVDDRSVLIPGWLDAIERAMEGDYIVAGAYEKRTAMTVENGAIQNAGIVIGEDSRVQYIRKHNLDMPWVCPGQWLFGCNLAMPLNWALQANGYSETLTDSLAFEDVLFGLVLSNNGFPIRYDPSMKMIEDRTPELSGPVTRRTDKGKSPEDKSHKVLDIIREAKVSPNPFDLRSMRASVQGGKPFPMPCGPTVDWWDNMPIKEFDNL